MMKKFSFTIIGVALMGCILSSCSPSRWFMINGSGIATYNRHTGQFEVLWEHKETPVEVVHDTIYVDSCNLAQKPMR